MYESSFINCAVCQLVFLLSFFFVLLNFLIFYSLIIRICECERFFLLLLRLRHFTSFHRVFSVGHCAFFSFERKRIIFLSFSLRIRLLLLLPLFCLLIQSLGHTAHLIHSYRHPSRVSHFVITLVEFIVNYCCLNIYLFFSISRCVCLVFRLEQHS